MRPPDRDPAVAPPHAPATEAARDVEGPEVGGARPVAPDPAVLLLARADRARAAQQPEQAAALLDELVATYSQHPAAPLAALLQETKAEAADSADNPETNDRTAAATKEKRFRSLATS